MLSCGAPDLAQASSLCDPILRPQNWCEPATSRGRECAHPLWGSTKRPHVNKLTKRFLATGDKWPPVRQSQRQRRRLSLAIDD